MTEEEYRKRMENPRYKELEVTDKDSGKDYVFISYRANNWEKILTEIVYKLQNEYGLRIYFDKNFASDTNIWIDQFTYNMDDPHCKAMLCFIDDGYCRSYATLLELMHAMNKKSKLSDKIIPINFNVNWKEAENIADDTGLGDPKNNPAVDKEVMAFDREFGFLKENSEYKDIAQFYDTRKWTPNYPILQVNHCSDIFNIIQPKNKRDYVDSDDFYHQFIIETIMKKAGDSVFEKKVQNSEISWSGFEAIQAFTYNGNSYNVKDAKQAYIEIVDVIKQSNPSFDTKSIVEGETQEYALLTDGSELDMVNGGYGKLLKIVPEIKQAEIKLYSNYLDNAQKAREYTILSRKIEVPIPDRFTDTIDDFNGYFTKLSTQFKENWIKSNKKGNTPSINMEIKLRFDCEFLENHTIDGYKWKSVFTEMMNYFYQMSGEEYYDYAVKQCDRPGIAEPLVINFEMYDKQIKDKSRYASVADNTYFFLNSYSAKELVKAVIKQISLYFEFLNTKQISTNISNVYVDYKIDDSEIRKLMMEIRKDNGGRKNNRIVTSPTTSDMVDFEPESFSGFVKRFKSISDKYKDEWKKNNDGNTPSIPFTNIVIHMPEDIVKNSEIPATNWKPIFNMMMDEFYTYSGGEYCKYRIDQEVRKNIKTPIIVTKSDFNSEKIPCNRYQPIAGGEYYFFNSYGVPELIKAMKDEMKCYIDFTNDKKGTQAGLEEVQISYSLPEGKFAEMFS